MPQGKDHCRSCGADVLIGSTGDVCEGCKKTVCRAKCGMGACPGPHPDLPPTPSAVSHDEHAALKAELNDEAALERRLADLRAARGEKVIGVG